MEKAEVLKSEVRGQELSNRDLASSKNSSSRPQVFPWAETFAAKAQHMPNKLSLWWWLFLLWMKHLADAGTQQMFGTSGWTRPHRGSFLHCLSRI